MRYRRLFAVAAALACVPLGYQAIPTLNAEFESSDTGRISVTFNVPDDPEPSPSETERTPFPVPVDDTPVKPVPSESKEEAKETPELEAVKPSSTAEPSATPMETAEPSAPQATQKETGDEAGS